MTPDSSQYPGGSFYQSEKIDFLSSHVRNHPLIHDDDPARYVDI
jgi:hypothetical protein